MRISAIRIRCRRTQGRGPRWSLGSLFCLGMLATACDRGLDIYVSQASLFVAWSTQSDGGVIRMTPLGAGVTEVVSRLPGISAVRVHPDGLRVFYTIGQVSLPDGGPSSDLGGLTEAGLSPAPTGHQLGRAEVSGKVTSPLYSGQLCAVGLALDGARGRAYWGASCGDPSTSGLKAGPLEPASTPTLLVPLASLSAASGAGRQIVLDSERGLLYFSTLGSAMAGRAIYRVKTDGTDLKKLRPATAPGALALDPDHGTLYFADSSVTGNDQVVEAVWRMDLDGQNAVKLLDLSPPYTDLSALAVDPAAGMLVIAAHGVDKSSASQVLRTDLFGRDPREIWKTPASIHGLDLAAP